MQHDWREETFRNIRDFIVSNRKVAGAELAALPVER
jgi:hypothetical protein